jgi:hypothetical protein
MTAKRFRSRPWVGGVGLLFLAIVALFTPIQLSNWWRGMACDLSMLALLALMAYTLNPLMPAVEEILFVTPLLTCVESQTDDHRVTKGLV